MKVDPKDAAIFEDYRGYWTAFPSKRGLAYNPETGSMREVALEFKVSERYDTFQAAQLAVGSHLRRN